MPAYEMTPNQRDLWKARVAPLFARESNCTTLATRAGFASPGAAAGYIGQFREGRSRALTHFLRDPHRLELLAEALGTTPSALEAIWRDVQAERVAAVDAIDLPGFEDWGPVAMDEGYVPLPLRCQGRLLVDDTVRERVLGALDQGVGVVGARGSGITTVLERFAAWAAVEGWHVTWGLGGGLPAGRAALLVIDDADIEDPETLWAWSKSAGHAVLWGGAGPSRAFNTAPHTTLRIEAVDVGWLCRLAEVAARVAPKPSAKRLRAVGRAAIERALEGLPLPTPEGAGCVLRALVDGHDADLRTAGPALVVQAARRRAPGDARKDYLGALRGAESWLGDAWVTSLGAPGGDLAEPLSTALLARARMLVRRLKLDADEHELLQAVLPLASGDGVVVALREAGLIRADATGDRIRLEGLLAPGVADAVAADPLALRTALLTGRRPLLVAVARAPGGPDALARALGELDGPALATAASSVAEEIDWLGRVAWTPDLVARWLATLIASGPLDRAFYVGRPGEDYYKEGKPRRRKTPTMPELWLAVGHVSELPTLAALRGHLAARARELHVTPPDASDEVLSLLLAIACPEAAIRRGEVAWEALDEELFPDEGWIEHVARTPEGLAFLLDPTRSPVALRVARIKPPKTTLAVDDERTQAVIWVELVGRLFEQAPGRAVEVMARTLGDLAARVASVPPVPPEPKDEADRRTYSERLTARIRWEADTHLELVAIAGGLAHAGRSRGALRDALRVHLPAWEAANDAADGPLGGWERRSALGSEVQHRSLARLLAFAYSEIERVRYLRTTDGHLSPFWEALFEARVPFDEALQLYAEVSSGALPFRVGRGAPDRLELSFHHDLKDDPNGARTVAASRVLLAVVARATPEELARIPVFVEAAETMPELPGSYLETPSVRGYLWARVSGLAERSFAWVLLGDDRFGFEHARFKEVEEVRVRARAEVEGVTCAVRLASGTALAPERWKRLANAALLAGVAAIELLALLEPTNRAGADPALVSEILQVVAGVDRARAQAWLLARLAEDPSSVDRAPLAEAWVAAGFGQRVLAERLAALPAGRRKGEGLVLALVRLGVEAWADWLADEDTADAALAVLVASPDWRKRMEEALARPRVPATAVLGHLLRQPRGIGIDVLDAASVDWPPTRRRELWQAAAAATRDRALRQEIWTRLARCG